MKNEKIASIIVAAGGTLKLATRCGLKSDMGVRRWLYEGIPEAHWESVFDLVDEIKIKSKTVKITCDLLHVMNEECRNAERE